MQNWFDGLNKRQVYFFRLLGVCALPFIFLYGLGLVYVVPWIYLELGTKAPVAERQ